MITWSPTKTELKERLRNQEAQYQRLIENIPEVVWRGTAEGDAIFISEKITSVFGYTPDEVVGAGARLWFGRMHPEDRDGVARQYAELFQEGRPFNVQYRIQHRDGHWMWWHDRAVLTEDSSVSGRYADGLLSDITEMKKLEEQFQHSQKMEAVGHLAGGIAHDFNNLVQVIGGYVELLERRVEGDTTAESYAGKIKTAAQGAASLTQQMSALDLNQTVSQFCSMLSRVLGENVELVLRPASDAAVVEADQTQIEQALMNLAVNARDAMPDGGKLIIEVNRIVADGAYTKQHAGLRPGEYVVLAVSDTGNGMDANTLSHAFEPFFTTKEPGKGTGLGLATVYGVVKQSGGHIYAHSEPGKGSSFQIYLPAFHALPAKTPAPATVPFAEGTETILLVEDEAAVRDLARILLEKLGYGVLCASNSDEAMHAARAGKIDLLLTDVVMPRCSGTELAQNLASLQPKMKILYMTGYTDDALLHHQLLESKVSVLRKPFTREQLAAAVRNTLDGLCGKQRDSLAGELVNG